MAPQSPEVRSIQKSSGKYYRVSLPKKFGDTLENKYEDLENFEITLEGDYIVIRPESEDFHSKGRFEFDVKDFESLAGSGDEPDLEQIERYMSKILTSFIMSGAEEIEIEVTGDDNIKDRREIEFSIEKILKSQRFGLNVTYLPRENKIEIREGQSDGIDSYIREVRNFLDSNLLRNLEHQHGGKDRWPNKSESSNDEEQLDRLWSLTTRQSSLQLLQLNRSEYPRVMVLNQVGKYLESVTDITKRIFDSCRELEDDKRDYDEMAVSTFEHKLFEILSMSQRYDEQLFEAAEKSYKLDVDAEDFIEEFNTYDNRIDKLDQLRDFEDDFWGIQVGENIDEGNLLEFGSKVGEICTLTERLLRYPRSITLAGFTGKTVNDIYDLQERQK